MGCSSSQPAPPATAAPQAPPPPEPKAPPESPPPAAGAPPPPPSVADIKAAIVEHAPEIQAAIMENGPALASAAFGALMGGEEEGVKAQEGAKEESSTSSLLADVGSLASSAATGQPPSMGALAGVGSAAAKATLTAVKNASSQDSPAHDRDTVGAFDTDDLEEDSPEDDETNIARPSEFVSGVPLMRYGQLRKQSAGMLVKNWRRRNFTIEKGVLRYYEIFINSYPFGERLKGCLSLKGYSVMPAAFDKANQILLKSGEGAALDLLVEAGDAAKRALWAEIFTEHVEYADLNQVAAPPAEANKFKTSTRF